MTALTDELAQFGAELERRLATVEALAANHESRLDTLETTTPPPNPDPPPASGPGQLGICTNNDGVQNAGSAEQSRLTSLHPKVIRTDYLSAALVSWAQANSCRVIGLGSPLTLSRVSSFAAINEWEYYNEPYFQAIDIVSWSAAARNFGQTFKQQYPTKRLYLPMNVHVNGGDFNGPQGWKPWVTYVFDAAPDIGQFYDGWTGHPYPPTDGGPPSFVNLDKVRGQLVARGFTKPCYITEVGWSTKTGAAGTTTEANQSTYINTFVTGCRTRSWINDICIYSLSETNATDKEGGFGLFRLNGTEKPAAATFRSLA